LNLSLDFIKLISDVFLVFSVGKFIGWHLQKHMKRREMRAFKLSALLIILQKTHNPPVVLFYRDGGGDYFVC
jgi:hypothetical protein